MMLGVLEGKKVLVTGGTRGIGAAVVKECVNAGAVVGFTYVESEKEAKVLVRSFGGRAFSYRADTSDMEAMKQVAEEFSLKPGSPSIGGLVVNAGLYKRSSFRDLSRDDWDRTLSVNLGGAYTAVKAALPFIMDGSIVMVSSQLAHRGSAHGSDYAASKAGLLGLARSLASDLAPGIRVNTISPGYVDTDIIAGDTDEKRSSRELEVPVGRVGSPGEIARPIVFMLSDEASYITGADLDVNGGLYIH
ncbi:MAG: SDR family oxidoreductase [Candidatus Thermoplasmatota archaeon]|nr:SDR family oxidoreductase [Candidatus Thermoplasmatota archaeon]